MEGHKFLYSFASTCCLDYQNKTINSGCCLRFRCMQRRCMIEHPLLSRDCQPAYFIFNTLSASLHHLPVYPTSCGLVPSTGIQESVSGTPQTVQGNLRRTFALCMIIKLSCRGKQSLKAFLEDQQLLLLEIVLHFPYYAMHLHVMELADLIYERTVVIFKYEHFKLAE